MYLEVEPGDMVSIKDLPKLVGKNSDDIIVQSDCQSCYNVAKLCTPRRMEIVRIDQSQEIVIRMEFPFKCEFEYPDEFGVPAKCTPTINAIPEVIL